MVEEALDLILHHTVCNAQNGVQSVLYNVVEWIKLDLRRKDVVREALGSHIAKYSNTDAAANGLSKMLLTSSSFIMPIMTFAIREMYTSMENQKYSVPYAIKEIIDIVELYNDGSKSPASCSESRSGEPPGRKSSECRLKRRRNKRKKGWETVFVLIEVVKLEGRLPFRIAAGRRRALGAKAT